MISLVKTTYQKYFKITNLTNLGTISLMYKHSPIFACCVMTCSPHGKNEHANLRLLAEEFLDVSFFFLLTDLFVKTLVFSLKLTSSKLV